MSGDRREPKGQHDMMLPACLRRFLLARARALSAHVNVGEALANSFSNFTRRSETSTQAATFTTAAPEHGRTRLQLTGLS